MVKLFSAKQFTVYIKIKRCEHEACWLVSSCRSEWAIVGVLKFLSLFFLAMASNQHFLMDTCEIESRNIKRLEIDYFWVDFEKKWLFNDDAFWGGNIKLLLKTLKIHYTQVYIHNKTFESSYASTNDDRWLAVFTALVTFANDFRGQYHNLFFCFTS